MFTTDERPPDVIPAELPAAEAKAVGLRHGSGGGKGRTLSAVGWHNWRPHREVGLALLHVERRNPLMVTRLVVVESLTVDEALEVRTALLACAFDVALALKGKGVGNGCLDWRVDARNAGAVVRAFPRFRPVHQRRVRGDAILRRCPEN